ncbi:DUF4190 domain-containing protein [Demequina sp.]|uniref:DUF4190 domain-containing protein n=1 Tax=Demequina sp. TaxID=2050685 RepID=UPI003D0FA868
MSDNTPNEPVEPITSDTTIQPVPEVPASMASDLTPQPVTDQPMPAQPSPNLLADYQHPVGSAYDPMPLQGEIDDSRNWLGVVSLIFGIIGGSIIAIVFGIIGLSAVKKGKATNRSMNVWGIALGVFWLIVSIVATIAFVVWVVNESDEISAASVEVGDCYVSTIESTGTLEDVDPVFGECTTATNAEVYFITTYDGTATPGDADFASDVQGLCTSDAAIVNVDVDLASEYYVEYYLPTINEWDTADRTVVCALSLESGPVDEGVIDE